MGLNSDYNTVRGNILMMKPLPSTIQAYALLIQEDKQREVHSPSQFIADSAYMNVINQNQGSYKGKVDGKKIICRNCKMPGHSASKCYRIIGFPKDFKFTKGKNIVIVATGEELSGDFSSDSMILLGYLFVLML